MTKVKWTVLLLPLLLAGCADANPTADVPGFFHGWWHGFIVVFAWIWSLFDSSGAIYAKQNSGGWYDFGYVLGILGLTRVR